MDLTGVRTVGIIGAGVAGLATAKTLIAQGLTCTVFERNAMLGGVWAIGYSNFGTQVQRELYEFPDWPLPTDVPDFTPGPRVQRYLEAYAREFGVWPHIRFETTVTNLRKRTDAPGWVIVSETDGAVREEAFDLVVVCIGLYSNKPHMPEFPGQNRFGGEILHISALQTREPLKGKRVGVVGFGKSATDASLESAAVAAETTIIFRKAHWPVPPLVAGVLPFKWAMLNRLTSVLIPPYYRPSGVQKALHSLGKPLVWFWWRLNELLLRAQYGLSSRFGTRLSLVPKDPIEFDAFGEAAMLPRPDFYRLVRKDVIRAERTEILEYTPTGVVLKNGAKRDLDVVILATGWETDFGFLSDEVLSGLNYQPDGIYLYRQMVHPNVPNLAFIGYAATICSTLTYPLQARWLAELIKGTHRLPPAADMLRNIEEIKAWKRLRMPAGPSRAARLAIHMLHYHDELLADFGADPLRKTGIFAPFKEAFAPYEPRDYRSIASGSPG